jgi:circadian clock protein KaiB
LIRSPAARKVGKKPKPGHYLLRLFMAGKGPNSMRALSNLRALCQTHLKGRFTVETIDVVKDFDAAVRENILITTALILAAPLPRVVILGNLCDTQKVLLALRLPDGDV